MPNHHHDEPLQASRLHELSTKRARQDDADKGPWRRGVALPERKKQVVKQQQQPNKPAQQPQKTASSRIFSPAPPPKSSAWGSVPKAEPVAIPLVASDPEIQTAKGESNPISRTPTSMQPSKPKAEKVKEQTPPRNRWATAPPPKQSAWNVVPPKSSSSPAPISFPPLQQQQPSQQPSSNSKKQPHSSIVQSNEPASSPWSSKNPSAKRKKGAVTLGDAMPKALLKKGASPKQEQPTQQQQQQQQQQSILTEFPALSASTTSIVYPASKKAAHAPVVPASDTAAEKTTKPKKKKKSPKPTPSSIDAISTPKPPVVSDAHRSGMLFTGSMLASNNVVPVTPGRQRIRPRTKKFSSLKKKVLEERLRIYRAATQQEQPENEDASPATTIVVMDNYVQPDDDLSDPDEREELVDNLREMASKIVVDDGDDRTVRVLVDATAGCAVAFRTAQHARAAIECWNGLVVAGTALQCRSLNAEPATEMNDEEWQNWLRMKLQDEHSQHPPEAMKSTILLEKVLDEADLDDEDCLAESLEDIRRLAAKFGCIESLDVENTVDVRIVYDGAGVASKAADQLSKLVLGGQKLEAKTIVDGESTSPNDSTIYLDNILSEDDLEDEDCLEESLDDVKELAGKFGSVESLFLFEGNRVQVNFSSSQEAQLAVVGFHGMIVGGQTIEAVLAIDSTGDPSKLTSLNTAEPPKTLYSGDKIIPERFAECKRVPKIANTNNPRAYSAACCYPAAQADAVKELLRTMLAELMRLQKRAAENEKTNTKKARRRLVMGLREVARGIRSHKVKMVVMANNLDEYGAIDAKLQEILDLCQAEGVPVFFDFSKRALGKAMGKSIKIAVVGIQNADGANQEFKKLTTMSGTMLTK